MITQEIAAKVVGPSWASRIWDEFNAPYMGSLQKAVASDRAMVEVFPSKENVFRAFKETPYDEVRVVIVGQDPYHTPGLATGLAFSVPNETGDWDVPPSLKNILKEVEDDVGFKDPYPEIDLTRWAKQGVLLLNRTLTVREHAPRSHADLGWHYFTERVIKEISHDMDTDIVFMLWGSDAQAATDFMDPFNDLWLRASHPSPLAAYRSFFGCKHFSKCNEWLEKKGLGGINW